MMFTSGCGVVRYIMIFPSLMWRMLLEVHTSEQTRLCEDQLGPPWSALQPGVQVFRTGAFGFGWISHHGIYIGKYELESFEIEIPLEDGAKLCASTGLASPLLSPPPRHFLQLNEDTLELTGVLVDDALARTSAKVRAGGRVCEVNSIKLGHQYEDRKHMIETFKANISLRITLQRFELTWIQSDGCFSRDDDLLIATMRVAEAQLIASALENCEGFHFRGQVGNAPVKIYFKGKSDLVPRLDTSDPWTSFCCQRDEQRVTIALNRFDMLSELRGHLVMADLGGNIRRV